MSLSHLKLWINNQSTPSGENAGLNKNHNLFTPWPSHDTVVCVWTIGGNCAVSIWKGLGQGFTGVAVGGRACGPACHQIRRTFERFRACGALRSSVSHIEWLQGEGTFVGFQGSLVVCIQSTRERIATEYCL